MSQIVCFDPTNQVPVGTIIDDSHAPRAAARGAALLSVDRNRHYTGPAAGHVHRLLGEGWRYTDNLPERGAHTIIAITRETPVLYWFARIAPIDPAKPMSGRFKLVVDGSGGGLGGLRPVERVDNLPPIDKFGGCSVYGKGVLAVSIDGYASLILHGIANNTKVLAFACSAVAE